jgi:hypothetical protein
MNKTKKTGMFYVKRQTDKGETTDVVVMDKGVEIARYPSVAEFVAKHREGLYAIGRLEENLEQAIESHYTPYPFDPNKTQ